MLIDLADLFMTDLADIGIQPDPTRSTWAKVKAFPKNVEIEVSAVFNMSDTAGCSTSSSATIRWPIRAARRS